MIQAMQVKEELTAYNAYLTFSPLPKSINRRFEDLTKEKSSASQRKASKAEAKETEKTEKMIKRFRDADGVAYDLNLETGEVTKADWKKLVDSEQRSIARTRDKIKKILECNNLTLFATLTFRLEYGNFERRKIFRNFRIFLKKNDVKYLAVEELHTGKGEANGLCHYHIMLPPAAFDVLQLIPTGSVMCHHRSCRSNKCSKEYYRTLLREGYEPHGTDGQEEYMLTKGFRAGRATGIFVTDNESAYDYVTKYINKEGSIYGLRKKRYWCSKGLCVPETSVKETLPAHVRNFDIRKYLQSCLNLYGLDLQNKNVKLTYASSEGLCGKIKIKRGCFESAIKAVTALKQKRREQRHYAVLNELREEAETAEAIRENMRAIRAEQERERRLRKRYGFKLDPRRCILPEDNLTEMKLVKELPFEESKSPQNPLKEEVWRQLSLTQNGAEA